MTDLRQAAQQALEFLESGNFVYPTKLAVDLRTALEQQAEPVSPKCVVIIEVFDKDWRMEYLSLPVGKHKLYVQQYTYTAPQRKPLTDDQADQIIGGLQTCHHQSSKREFLKVWLRDWAAHNIKEQL